MTFLCLAGHFKHADSLFNVTKKIFAWQTLK